MVKFHRSIAALSLALSAVAAGTVLLAPAAAVAATKGYEFLKALRSNDLSKAQGMLGDNPSLIINTKDDSTGETALHIMVGKGDTDWTGYLLKLGANANAVDKERNTPLMVAATDGYDDGIALLLYFKAQVDLTNRKGETALILATKFKRTEAMKALLKAGANADKADYSGFSARQYAEQFGRDNRYLALIQSGGKDDADLGKAQKGTDGLDFSGIK